MKILLWFILAASLLGDFYTAFPSCSLVFCLFCLKWLSLFIIYWGFNLQLNAGKLLWERKLIISCEAGDFFWESPTQHWIVKSFFSVDFCFGVAKSVLYKSKHLYMYGGSLSILRWSRAFLSWVCMFPPCLDGSPPPPKTCTNRLNSPVSASDHGTVPNLSPLLLMDK